MPTAAQTGDEKEEEARQVEVRCDITKVQGLRGTVWRVRARQKNMQQRHL